MSNNTLIEVLSNELSNNQLDVSFKINPENEIFEGHFPNYPIVPGVVEMQIIERIINISLDLNVKLKMVATVKFLKPILPNNTSIIHCNINYSKNETSIDCTVTLLENLDVYLKMKGTYTILN